MRSKYRKLQTSPNLINFYLDIILLVGFIIIMDPELTGIGIHEWFSLALVAVIVIHIIWHWKWIVALTKKFFKKLFHQSRLKYVLNVFLLILFTLIFWSGVMESKSLLPFFGLQASNNPVWEWLHSITSDLMWFFVGLHLMLDWRWIVNAIQRYVLQPLHIIRIDN